MTTLSDKTTVYLNPLVKTFLQHKAVEQKMSVSEIINDHFADLVDDLEDLKVIEKRRLEPTVSFDDLLKDLGLSYHRLLRQKSYGPKSALFAQQPPKTSSP